MARTKGATADKLWADAIRIAAHREDADDDGKIRKRISIIADKLLRLAIDGDMQAIKEVGDRLDGRPAQALQHSGEIEATIVRKTIYEAPPE
jgi:molecular chaperone GrpE (heat shock protein)